MLESRLRVAGLRPTRQRVALANTIFRNGDRHLTAENLHEEVTASGFNVSLATVYNTLHQFTSAGLLRMIAVEGSKSYFDTNTSDHHHFYIEEDGEVVDVPVSNLKVENLPEPPEDSEEDGILTAEEIASLPLDGVEWVVLSACETGAGFDLGGQGVASLQQAAYAAPRPVEPPVG